MTRISGLIVFTVAAAVIATACGTSSEQKPAGSDTPPSSVPAAAAGSQSMDISFKSEPDPPKMGENTLEVMVMANSLPVTDADVAVEFFMAAMPSMNMAEMRNSVALNSEGAGKYRGTGSVMMSGTWDAIVRVKRGGQEVARRTFSVTAK